MNRFYLRWWRRRVRLLSLYPQRGYTRYLAIGGSLILEVGDDQADTVTKLVGRSVISNLSMLLRTLKIDLEL